MFDAQYFNNEAYEVERYDKVLANYEEANLKTMQSLSLLNFGQGFIFTTGLTAMLYLAYYGIRDGQSAAELCIFTLFCLYKLTVPLYFIPAT